MSDRHQTTPYPLRMGDDLRNLVANAARRSGRSMNAEIIARLEGTFLDEGDDVVSDPAFRRKIMDIFVPMVAELHERTLAAQKELALAGLSKDQIEAALQVDPHVPKKATKAKKTKEK